MPILLHFIRTYFMIEHRIDVERNIRGFIANKIDITAINKLFVTTIHLSVKNDKFIINLAHQLLTRRRKCKANKDQCLNLYIKTTFIAKFNQRS